MLIHSASNQYILARKTIECYSLLHNYTLIYLNLEEHSEYIQKCPGKDIMFRRHCINVEVMRRRPEIEWFLFLDADMGVVNPNHLIGYFLN